MVWAVVPPRVVAWAVVPPRVVAWGVVPVRDVAWGVVPEAVLSGLVVLVVGFVLPPM